MVEFIHSNLGIAIVGGVCTLLSSLITIFIQRLWAKKDSKKSSLQHKTEEYQEENTQLRKQLEIYEAVEQSTDGEFFVLKQKKMPICPICWTAEHKPFPIYEKEESGMFTCSHCKHKGIYNKIKVQKIRAEEQAASDSLLQAIAGIQGVDRGDDNFYGGYPRTF